MCVFSVLLGLHVSASARRPTLSAAYRVPLNYNRHYFIYRKSFLFHVYSTIEVVLQSAQLCAHIVTTHTMLGVSRKQRRLGTYTCCGRPHEAN